MNLNGRKETSFLIYGNLKEINSSSRCQQKITLEYLFKTDLRERAQHSTKCLRETSPLSTDQVKAHLTHKIWQDPTTCQNGYSLNQIHSTTEAILPYLLASLFDCGRHTGMINQSSSLPICSWSDQIPDETFDIFIPFVMIKTIHQDSPADGFHILLC